MHKFQNTSRMFATTHAGTRGFTVVELMVVVAVVSLLISIVLPAMQQSREVARTQICLSNMRQCTVVTQSYVEENKQYLPYCSNYTSVQAQNHLRWLDLMNQYDTANTALTASSNKYGRIRRCPGGMNLAWNNNTSQFTNSFYSGTSTVSTTTENTQFFGPNATMIVRDDQWAAYPPIRVDTIPRNLNLIAEAVDTGTSGNPNQDPLFTGGSPVDGSIRFRHLNVSTNLSFLDGHAANWLGADILSAQNYRLAHPWNPAITNPIIEKDLFNAQRFVGPPANGRVPWGWQQ